MSAGRKILLAIAGATGIAGSQGCVQGVTVTPEVGVNMPTSQRYLTDFGSAATYGISAGVKNSKGVEAKIAYKTHDAVFDDGAQRNELTARDVSVGVSVPLYDNGKVTFQATAELTARSEDESAESLLIPGLSLGEDSRSSTGWGVGVSVEGKVGPGNLGGEVMAEGFGNGSYEETGIKAKVFYKVFFKTK